MSVLEFFTVETLKTSKKRIMSSPKYGLSISTPKLLKDHLVKGDTKEKAELPEHLKNAEFLVCTSDGVYDFKDYTNLRLLELLKIKKMGNEVIIPPKFIVQFRKMDTCSTYFEESDSILFENYEDSSNPRDFLHTMLLYKNNKIESVMNVFLFPILSAKSANATNETLLNFSSTINTLLEENSLKEALNDFNKHLKVLLKNKDFESTVEYYNKNLGI